LRFKAGNKGIGIGDLGLSAPATLCVWLKAERSKADRRILGQLDGPPSQGGCLRLIDGSLQVWNGQVWSVVVEGLSDKHGWQHVAVVYEADGRVTGYLNGKKSQTAYSAFDFAWVKAVIGAPYLNYAVPFEGDLDDFRIHNTALKEKDIKAIREEGKKGLGVSSQNKRGFLGQRPLRPCAAGEPVWWLMRLPPTSNPLFSPPARNARAGKKEGLWDRV